LSKWRTRVVFPEPEGAEKINALPAIKGQDFY
jgi:hypothetical protein